MDQSTITQSVNRNGEGRTTKEGRDPENWEGGKEENQMKKQEQSGLITMDKMAGPTPGKMGITKHSCETKRSPYHNFIGLYDSLLNINIVGSIKVIISYKIC